MIKKQNDKLEKEFTEVDDLGDEDNQVEILKKTVSVFEEKYKRALADYQNLQKRVDIDKKNWVKIANQELLARLIPVLDTLMLAGQHIDNEGLKVSIDQFLEVLKVEGVVKIDVDKKEFNPEIMEAIAVGEGEENKVIEEIRPGYMIYDKVLRPSQVKVGKHS